MQKMGIGHRLIQILFSGSHNNAAKPYLDAATGVDFEPTICKGEVDVGVAGRGSSDGQQFACRDMGTDIAIGGSVVRTATDSARIFEKKWRGRERT